MQNNWLYTGKAEWFINQNKENQVYALTTTGEITTTDVSEEMLVRPVVTFR